MSLVNPNMTFGLALRKGMYERPNTEEMILATVSADGMQLEHVKNKTPRIIYEALKQNWRALKFVDPSDIDNFLVRQLILWDPKAASLLPPHFHLKAVIQEIHFFDYIENPSLDACRFVIERKPDWIAKCKNPSVELCLLAIQKRHKDARFMAHCFRDYNNPNTFLGQNYFKDIQVTYPLAKASLQMTQGYSYISLPEGMKTQFAEEALKINPKLAEFIPLTPIQQEQIIRQNPAIISAIQNPSEDLMRLACCAAPHNLQYIKNPSRTIVWECAEKWADALKYAVEQDEELCVHAVQHFHTAIRHVKENHLQVWLKAGANTHVTIEDLFPAYCEEIHTSRAADVFFHRIVGNLITSRTMSITEDRLEDPITLEPVEKGTIVAFLDGHFAGTLTSLLQICDSGFRKSNFNSIFVPMKNTLVETRHLRWRMI